MTQDDEQITDLDRLASSSANHHAPSTHRTRPRRQCKYCYTNRSSIELVAFKGLADRALEALRRAHPEEYDALLQQERDLANATVEELWARHLGPHRYPRH